MTGPKVIMLSGKAGAGKDTVASHLALKYGYYQIAFADPMRQLLATLVKYQGADPQTVIRSIYDRDVKEKPNPFFGDKSYRQAMQTLGTEWGRDCMGEDFWARIALNRIKRAWHESEHWVISDLRFPNERAIFEEEFGGQMEHWEILRNDCEEVANHLSESALKDVTPDILLTNHTSLETLYGAVDELIEGWE